MALLSKVPQNQALTLVQGSAPQVNIVAKNADGTTFDATGFDSTVSLKVYANRQSTTAVINNTTIATVGSATGLLVSFTAAVIETILAAIGSGNAWYTFEGSDGTDTVNAGYGTLAVTPTALPDS